MSAPVDNFVSACASPPSIESKYTCDSPVREERNASVLPSGDHTGEESCPLCVNCIAAPPTVGTIQMLLKPRFASMSGVDTVYATHFPSRETCGSAMRCSFIMSSKVMACFAVSCAEPGNAQPDSRAIAQPHRMKNAFISFFSFRNTVTLNAPCRITDIGMFPYRIQKRGAPRSCLRNRFAISRRQQVHKRKPSRDGNHDQFCAVHPRHKNSGEEQSERGNSDAEWVAKTVRLRLLFSEHWKRGRNGAVNKKPRDTGEHGVPAKISRDREQKENDGKKSRSKNEAFGIADGSFRKMPENLRAVPSQK